MPTSFRGVVRANLKSLAASQRGEMKMPTPLKGETGIAGRESLLGRSQQLEWGASNKR